MMFLTYQPKKIAQQNKNNRKEKLISKVFLPSKFKGLKRFLATLTACALISIVTLNIGYCRDLYKKELNKNPVLHSENDITDELIKQIYDNELESITIDYQFTRCPDYENKEDQRKYDFDRYVMNPFWRANRTVPLSRLDFEIKFTSKVKSLACAFKGFTNLKSVNIKDTSNITSMQQMFYNAFDFDQPIGDWNTSKVTDMALMFLGAREFNQPLEKWDTSKVTDMTAMFYGAAKFNQPIGNWNTSNVTSMYSMFEDAYRFNQPIGKWDTSKVTDMRKMFKEAHSFNQPIADWNISNVTQMKNMFKNARSFKQPIDKWDLSKVTDRNEMYDGDEDD